MLIEKIQYKKLERVTTAEGRKYVGDDNIPVPSVTTILDKTSDKTALIAWRKRVGEEEANRVSRESAGLGTKVHNAIEKHILGEEVTFGNNMVSVMAKDMSELMINEGFANIDFAAIDDRITAQEESDEVTQEQQKEWHASKLDPTQKLLHDQICQRKRALVLNLQS